jgi:hypothetical protein
MAKFDIYSSKEEWFRSIKKFIVNKISYWSQRISNIITMINIFLVNEIIMNIKI